MLAIEDKRATNKAIIGLRRAAAERKAADEAQKIEALEEQCDPEAGAECPSPEDVATAVAAKAAAKAEAEAGKKIGGLFGEGANSTNFGPVILARAQDENHRKRLQNSLGVLAMVPKARARARRVVSVWSVSFCLASFCFVLTPARCMARRPHSHTPGAANVELDTCGRAPLAMGSPPNSCRRTRRCSPCRSRARRCACSARRLRRSTI